MPMLQEQPPQPSREERVARGLAWLTQEYFPGGLPEALPPKAPPHWAGPVGVPPKARPLRVPQGGTVSRQVAELTRQLEGLEPPLARADLDACRSLKDVLEDLIQRTTSTTRPSKRPKSH